ncbi:MAG TPA: ATP-binding protein [Paludibacter sp.]|nr:ATP-binding protein [Paludibacter sp.]
MDLVNIGESIGNIKVEISYKIIQLFSAGLYSSPNKAFEELICNSYDAFASHVDVYVPYDLSNDESCIWILDNGEGMNSSELEQLWKIGESNKRDGNDRDSKRLQIGRFGIGKLSTYILTRNLTYLSKKEDRFLLATMDFDLVNSGSSETLFIDKREVSEQEAKSVIDFYCGSSNLHMKLFGCNSEESWTFSLLTGLKPKATEIKIGRLKWILKTALPLNPQFNLFLNDEAIESSKISIPILKTWVIGEDDITAQGLGNSKCYIDSSGQPTLDLESLKGIAGEFVLYADSLLTGKSSSLGRSHGIFLNVRGRLINLDDALLGMEPFSHGAFNRTRIIVNADALDDYLTSTRESIKSSVPYEQLKHYIKSKFNNEVRKYYFDYDNREAAKKTISYRLSQTSYTTSRRPIYSFIKKYYENEIENPFLIEKPDKADKDGLLQAFDADIEAGTQIIEEVDFAPISSESPIAKLNLKLKTLNINTLHPFVANYSDAYKNALPLQSVAITEVLTEAHLYELSINESIINEVMRRRDLTLRELALSDRDGIPAVALLVRDAVVDASGLEDAVNRALIALGFDSVRIGGKNAPDGKASAHLGFSADSVDHSYSLTFDAKSTSKKRIQASTARLSALKRHQSDYEATYCLEVSVGFEGEESDDSAISKEARQQKVTLMKTDDLIRLLYLAAPKQLGLNKLEDLFKTCYAPLEVAKWIDELEKSEIPVPPYYEIIDIIYDFQREDSEPPIVETVRLRLNEKLDTKFSVNNVREYIKALSILVPGCVSMDCDRYVSVQNNPETIKSRVSKVINHSSIPQKYQNLYVTQFKKADEQ